MMFSECREWLLDFDSFFFFFFFFFSVGDGGWGGGGGGAGGGHKNLIFLHIHQIHFEKQICLEIYCFLHHLYEANISMRAVKQI